jgi:hypothetical protein
MAYISKRRISPPSDKKERVKRHNEKWNKYYGSPRWKKLRDYYMSISPLCKDCAIEGRSVPADECHHSTPWDWWPDPADKWKALLCVDLLVPLCKKHHLERHKHLYKPDNFEQTKVYKMIHDMT